MAYAYIERTYGKRFEPGQRVQFTEYAGDRGKGVVLDEGTHGHYVRVLFDDGHEGNCHPLSVEIET
jgi:hypothetical protein